MAVIVIPQNVRQWLYLPCSCTIWKTIYRKQIWNPSLCSNCLIVHVIVLFCRPFYCHRGLWHSLHPFYRRKVITRLLQ